MSLLASDAFSSLHDSTRSRLSNSSRAMATSPFVSGTQSPAASHSTVNPRMTVRPRTGKGPSMGDPNGHIPFANGHSNETDDKLRSRSRAASFTRLQRRKGNNKQQTVPFVVAVTRSQSSSPSAAPIDWEIPRKTLHSSIGFLTLYLYFSHGSPNMPVFEMWYERCLGFLMRESEKKTTNGVI
ncbi:hypothetical protein BC835DRAFT_183318 [Cytidiella melzeri]|nr:hypothetical protein BC835DRAFT_183318 [Cytidiella melzeri]